jgi:hypothetical protein
VAANLSIASIPIEHTDFKIGIRRADALGVRTNINITKTPNTDLIKEAGVEVIDKRVELITKVGTIITSIIAVPKAAETTLTPGEIPKIINTNGLLRTYKVGREGKQGIDAGHRVTMDFDPIPPDADSIVNPIIA